MVTSIQNAIMGMDRASQTVDAASVNLLRAALDSQKETSQQFVNMVAGARVYDANAKVIETSEKLVDVVV
jgi:flagellar basal body rod protein FlgG